jgi:hypothetical protein
MKNQRREAALFFISDCGKFYSHKNIYDAFYGIFLEKKEIITFVY